MSYQEVAAKILECSIEEIWDCLFVPENAGVLFPEDIWRLVQEPDISFEIDSTIETTHITIISLVNGRKESLWNLNVRHCI